MRQWWTAVTLVDGSEQYTVPLELYLRKADFEQKWREKEERKMDRHAIRETEVMQ